MKSAKDLLEHCEQMFAKASTEHGVPPCKLKIKTGYFTSYSNNTIKNQNQDEH